MPIALHVLFTVADIIGTSAPPPVCLDPVLDSPYVSSVASSNGCECDLAQAMPHNSSRRTQKSSSTRRPCYSTWNMADTELTTCSSCFTPSLERSVVEECLTCDGMQMLPRFFLIGDSHVGNVHAALSIALKEKMSLVVLSNWYCAPSRPAHWSMAPDALCSDYHGIVRDVIRQAAKQGDIVAITNYDAVFTPSMQREAQEMTPDFVSSRLQWGLILSSNRSNSLTKSLSANISTDAFHDMMMTEFALFARSFDDFCKDLGVSLLILGDVPDLVEGSPSTSEQIARPGCIRLFRGGQTSCRVKEPAFTQLGCSRVWPKDYEKKVLQTYGNLALQVPTYFISRMTFGATPVCALVSFRVLISCFIQMMIISPMLALHLCGHSCVPSCRTIDCFRHARPVPHHATAAATPTTVTCLLLRQPLCAANVITFHAAVGTCCSPHCHAAAAAATLVPKHQLPLAT